MVSHLDSDYSLDVVTMNREPYLIPLLAAHYLHHLLGSPFSSIEELPTSVSPIEVAGALPGKDLKRKYIEHNRHVMVIYDFIKY